MGRSECKNYARCGKTGHYYDILEKTMVRCPCLEEELLKIRLGPFFYSKEIVSRTDLEKYLGTSMVLEGQLDQVKRHVARALMTHTETKLFKAIDAYRLIEIFLEKDEEFTSTWQVLNTDLLIIMLGFGDPKNRYLPELVVQALSRRKMENLPTWVILGIPREMVAGKYSSELGEELGKLKRARVE